ncbi:MAG: GTPase Era [Desulfobacteraceae bacterium]|nr:GTPase Era [Desulfobacteraceae bacterium]MBC2754418.1 GTPase Era [Desulfobacteraceae bacterium]
MTDINEQFQGFKSGFAAIIGAPNVGKSTLLNTMIGEKISITSSKPQTTRNRIAGVCHQSGFQIVFLDTPGIHMSKKPLNSKMVEVAMAAINDVDLVLLVIDASNLEPASEQLILNKLRDGRKPPAILAINKIDKVKKPKLLNLINKWAKAYTFEEIIPVSAIEGTQVDDLLTAMKKQLPDGPPYFPEDMITDMPERFIAAEMIREKVFELTAQEIPFSTAVTIEAFEELSKKNLVRIHAAIHIERKSQKGIIIGKQGAMLRQIGEAARLDIERMVGTRVFLKLFVRIEKNWSKDARAMRKLGY